MEDAHAKTATNSSEDSDTTVDGFFVKDDADNSTKKAEKSMTEVVGDSTKLLPKPMTETPEDVTAVRHVSSSPKDEILPDLGSSGAKETDESAVAEISGTATVAELTAEAMAEAALGLTQDFANASVDAQLPTAAHTEQTSEEHSAQQRSVPNRQPKATTTSALSPQGYSRSNLPDHSPILKLAPKPSRTSKQTPSPSSKRTEIAPESEKRWPQQHSLLKLAPKPSQKLSPSPKSVAANMAKSMELSQPKRRRLVKKGKPKKLPPRQPYASTVKNPMQNPRSFKLQTVGPRQIGGIQDQTFAHRTPACSCARDSSRMMTSKKKTACLKLYCPCFSHGSYCTERCACSSTCSNHSDAEEIRTQAISETLYKDSNAFRLEAGKTSELQNLVRASLFRGDPPSFLADDQSFATQNPDAFVRRSLLSTQVCAVVRDSFPGLNLVSYNTASTELLHYALQRSKWQGGAPFHIIFTDWPTQRKRSVKTQACP